MSNCNVFIDKTSNEVHLRETPISGQNHLIWLDGPSCVRPDPGELSDVAFYYWIDLTENFTKSLEEACYALANIDSGGLRGIYKKVVNTNLPIGETIFHSDDSRCADYNRNGYYMIDRRKPIDMSRHNANGNAHSDTNTNTILRETR